MPEHFIITLDRGHLPIYAEDRVKAQFAPRLALVEALDFPDGVRPYTARETDQAGRFFGGALRQGGASADERLPTKREQERRRVDDLVIEVDAFLRERPEATWDLAAPAELQPTVMAQLSAAIRRRLRRTLAKDLTRQTLTELRAYFAAAASKA